MSTPLERGQNGPPECSVYRKKTALLDKENIPESPAIDGGKNAEASETPQKYDSSKLGKLEGLEAVRKKPGMYIGGTDERALHHCVSEVLDNSVDEHLAGHCDRIDVAIHVDGSISVRDKGRGITVDIHPQYGIPGVELVLTTLHSGNAILRKDVHRDRKSTRLNSSHDQISYAVFCLKKKKHNNNSLRHARAHDVPPAYHPPSVWPVGDCACLPQPQHHAGSRGDSCTAHRSLMV